MSRSLAQALELQCTNCGQSFTTDVWLIVEAKERPDLVAQIEAETLHTARCPHCGAAYPLDAPVLYHDTATELLVFASQEGSTVEQDQTLAQELGQHLITSIPVEERRPYLATAHTVVGMDGLRRALAGELAPEADELSEALRALMAATTPQEVREAAAKHPVLQAEDAHVQLQQYIDQLQAEHRDLAEALAQRLAVLRTAEPEQHLHPTLAFIQALLDADSHEQRQALLRARPIDVTPEVPTILEALADQAQRRQLEAVARDMLVIRDEILNILGRDTPVTPSA